MVLSTPTAVCCFLVSHCGGFAFWDWWLIYVVRRRIHLNLFSPSCLCLLSGDSCDDRNRSPRDNPVACESARSFDPSVSFGSLLQRQHVCDAGWMMWEEGWMSEWADGSVWDEGRGNTTEHEKKKWWLVSAFYKWLGFGSVKTFAPERIHSNLHNLSVIFHAIWQKLAHVLHTTCFEKGLSHSLALFCISCWIIWWRSSVNGYDWHFSSHVQIRAFLFCSLL